MAAVMMPTGMTRAGINERPDLEQLIAKIQATYDGTKDLTAHFIQELTLDSINRTEREEGVVYFKNPGRMYWDYRMPKSKKLIVNLQKAWLYAPADRVVYVQDAKTMYQSKLALRFLSGIGSIQDDFYVQYASPEAMDPDGHYLLVLIPKQKDAGTDQLLLTVDRKGFQILECRFFDSFGNLMRIRFQNIRVNQSLPESLFHFTPPRGAEILNVSP